MYDFISHQTVWRISQINKSNHITYSPSLMTFLLFKNTFSVFKSLGKNKYEKGVS